MRACRCGTILKRVNETTLTCPNCGTNYYECRACGGKGSWNDGHDTVVDFVNCDVCEGFGYIRN